MEMIMSAFSEIRWSILLINLCHCFERTFTNRWLYIYCGSCSFQTERIFQIITMILENSDVITTKSYRKYAVNWQSNGLNLTMELMKRIRAQFSSTNNGHWTCVSRMKSTSSKNDVLFGTKICSTKFRLRAISMSFRNYSEFNSDEPSTTHVSAIP